MIGNAPPLRFRHHVLAVLAAAMLGATLFSVIWTAALGAAAGYRSPGLTWLATMALLSWLSMFLLALPSAGLALSLLWPVTRRRTTAANWICLAAGATMGIVLAPLASPTMHGATLLQFAVAAAQGTATASFYLAVARRLGQDAGSTGVPVLPAA